MQANFLWAYAALGERVGGSCLVALSAHALTLLPSSDAQVLANTAWALATMDVLEPVRALQLACVPPQLRCAYIVKCA